MLPSPHPVRHVQAAMGRATPGFGTNSHTYPCQIGSDHAVSIGSQLRGTPCQAFAKDMKVRSGRMPLPGRPMKGMFSYPDLLVVRGDIEFHDQYRDVLLNPSLIVEVLSASTSRKG